MIIFIFILLLKQHPRTHEPLRVLPLPVPVVLVAAVPDDVRHDAEEGQLLVVLRQALALGEVKLPGAVVVQDVAEDVLEGENKK